MRIQKRLEILLQYYGATRGKGHTALLKEGTKHYNKDFLVLAWHKQDSQLLEIGPHQVVSWENLENLRGNNKPLAIDNGAMTEILGDALMRIETLEEENEKLIKERRRIYVNYK